LTFSFHFSLQYFVKKQLLHTVAVIYKRGWLDETNESIHQSLIPVYESLNGSPDAVNPYYLFEQIFLIVSDGQIKT